MDLANNNCQPPNATRMKDKIKTIENQKSLTPTAHSTASLEPVEVSIGLASPGAFKDP
jgi:hypothetical protein